MSIVNDILNEETALSTESKEKVKLIRKILEKKVTVDISEERQAAWFNELYDKSLSDLRIYYNVYK